jgi:YgiT-type zinc finger domain-containing protein
MQPGVTTVTLERDATTLVFKNVPAQVCQTCGEAYLSAEVTRHLQALTEEAARIGVQVDVRQYAPPLDASALSAQLLPEKIGQATFQHLIYPTEA